MEYTSYVNRPNVSRETITWNNYVNQLQSLLLFVINYQS